jgi:hypothetical protein
MHILILPSEHGHGFKDASELLLCVPIQRAAVGLFSVFMPYLSCSACGSFYYFLQVRGSRATGPLLLLRGKLHQTYYYRNRIVLGLVDHISAASK